MDAFVAPEEAKADTVEEKRRKRKSQEEGGQEKKKKKKPRQLETEINISSHDESNG